MQTNVYIRAFEAGDLPDIAGCWGLPHFPAAYAAFRARWSPAASAKTSSPRKTL
jgi:hypothetical protein